MASLEFTLNELIVLCLLLDGREMHGLEIVKAAAAQTSASQASMGTVYPLLKNLVRHGWLDCRRTGGSPRIFYSLTELGRAQFPLVAAQWGQVNESITALLGGLLMPPVQDRAASPRH